MKEPLSTLVKPSTIRFERLLPGPVERVWAYLTESKKRATWLAGGEFDLRLGGRIELVFDNEHLTDETPPPGARATGVPHAEGHITRLEPMKVLGFTWNLDSTKTEVLFELAPRGSEVLLTIHHRLPEAGELLVAVGGGWPTHVGILEDQLSGTKPRPFFTTHGRQMKEFAATIDQAVAP